ncbi:hypothetical protein SYNPS1DRAFT_26472 [Syncephalis pseudoplumigaleata]|uniref:Uncharacterized protein n=1 Tax=Syncephalis pseudoplumigaleata TaxID=1712513 RepID=A0A4V1J2A6_9FUNG|nr:hypothetical protein SYNPS1DRAFT_26472 [Syncephalis pseudoplumigaleata]|eukprot:RKP27889.1 hypothetical protein SYNPS1DRAFT_26472 [Syncephalis pseudoplumigaleata]
MVTFGALTPMQGRPTAASDPPPPAHPAPARAALVADTPDSHAPSYCVASCGGDLLVAKGQQLQLVHLRDLEEEAATTTQGARDHDAVAEDVCSGVWQLPQRLEQAVPTWMLKADAVTFPVKHLSVSPNHRLIVAVGERQLAVIALPTGRHHHYPASGEPASLYCSSFALGRQYHRDNAKSARILKVDWHPLSEADVHLGVLTDDGLLRLYDLGKNLEEPEQLIDLVDRLGFRERMGKSAALARNASAIFTVDPESAQVVTFSFGRSETSWSSLAVYLLMCNGDIYTVCPVLPHRYRLRASHIRMMLAQAERDRIELGFSDDNDAKTKLVDQQIQWLTRHLALKPPATATDGDTAAAASSETAEEDAMIHTDAEAVSSLPAAKPQGPYLMQPAPWEIDDNIHSACDLLCLPTSPADLLVIAYSNGKIDVCIAADPPEPSLGLGFWEQDDVDLPRLAVHECLQLFTAASKDDGQLTRLLADPSYHDRFYCYHANGVFMVDCHPWLAAMERWWLSEGELDLEQDDLPKSAVKHLLSCVSNPSSDDAEEAASMSAARSCALCISKDPSINYAMVYTSIREQLVLQELPIRIESDALKKSADEHNDEAEHEQVSLLNIADAGGAGPSDPNRSIYATLLDANNNAKQAAQRLTELTRSLHEQAAPRLSLSADAGKAAAHGDGADGDEVDTRVLEARIQQCKQVIEAYLSRMKTVREAITYMEKRATTQQQEINRQKTAIDHYGSKIRHELQRQVETTQERMGKLLDQQRRLTRRAADLTHRSAAYRDPSLNKKEKQFLDSLHDMQQKLPSMFARIEQMSYEVKRIQRLSSRATADAMRGPSTGQREHPLERISMASEHYGALEGALQSE